MSLRRDCDKTRCVVVTVVAHGLTREEIAMRVPGISRPWLTVELRFNELLRFSDGGACVDS